MAKRPLHRAKNSLTCFKRILTNQAHATPSAEKETVNGVENHISSAGTGDSARSPTASPPTTPNPSPDSHHKLHLALETPSHQPSATRCLYTDVHTRHTHGPEGLISGPGAGPWTRSQGGRQSGGETPSGEVSRPNRTDQHGCGPAPAPALW